MNFCKKFSKVQKACTVNQYPVFTRQNGYGSLVGDAGTFLQIKAADIRGVPKKKQMVLFETMEVNFENNLLYSITAEDFSVRIRKIRIPVSTLG